MHTPAIHDGVRRSEQHRRILYVEDEDELRDPSRRARAERWEVSRPPTPSRRWRSCPAVHGLVITDYALPGESGRWLLETAAERGLLAGCGAIVVTGAQVDAFGPVLVLRKPVDLDMLVAEAAAVLEAVAWQGGRRPRSGVERRFEAANDGGSRARTASPTSARGAPRGR